MDRYSILLGKAPPVEITFLNPRTLIIGPRRSGKTTYLCQQVDGYIKQNQPVIFACNTHMIRDKILQLFSSLSPPSRDLITFIKSTRELCDTSLRHLIQAKETPLIFDNLEFLNMIDGSQRHLVSQTIEWPEETSAALFPKNLRICLYRINHIAPLSPIMASYTIDDIFHLPDTLDIDGIKWTVVKMYLYAECL